MPIQPDLTGKRVHVIFREPMHHNGITIISMVGTCGGVTPQLVALNDVTKAFGPGDVDVTDKLGIKGQCTVVATRKIGFMVTE